MNVGLTFLTHSVSVVPVFCILYTVVPVRRFASSDLNVYVVAESEQDKPVYQNRFVVHADC